MFGQIKLLCVAKNLNQVQKILSKIAWFFKETSVADPDLADPYVFGLPGSGSGSIDQRFDPDPSITKQK
jgi:hypothetical protein